MKKTKVLTFCALMSALGVGILFLGSIVDIFDLCCVLVSSVLIFIVCEELGNSRALATYAVCAVISFLILPSKLVAVEYIMFGAYPVLRKFFEARPKPVCIALKALYMVASSALAVIIVRFLFTSAETRGAIYIEIITALIGIVCLVLCDVIFKRFSRLYHSRIRASLRIDKFFR